MTGDQLTVDERIDAALERAQRLRDQADALRAAPLQVGPLDGPDAQVRAVEMRMATVTALLNGAVIDAAEAIVLSNRHHNVALTKRDWGAAGNEPVQVRP